MIEPGFMVLQSNRLENLRQVTVQWLRTHPLQPLENEILLVQSNGISQWLKLALAADTDNEDVMEAGCGIAAATDISLPGRFHWRAYRAVLGDLPQTSPFDKPLLSWRLLRLLPSLLQDPQFSALQHFLADDTAQRKQFQLAQRLADLLDQYQIYRADWLNHWAAGIDEITQRNHAVAMPATQSWQAALWRRLLQDIPAQERDSGRAQVHKKFLAACEHLSATNRPHDLPRRVVVFGLSSLPGQTLEVLAAIARCTQVVLCVHNPSMHYWGDIVDPGQLPGLFRAPYKRQAARTDFPAIHDEASSSVLDELFSRGNTLLAAWGKQGRDYIRLLDEHDDRSAYEALFQSQQIKIDLFEEPDETTLLGQLQGDIFHLRSTEEARQFAEQSAADADGTISFHIAHGIQREVEILQDHLLDLFNNDTELRPRDVLVMVPDINLFAPAVQAVFGRLPRHDKRYIPFTLSDQGQRQQAPLYLALEMLLQLPQQRLGVSELLDFLDVPAVQKAFAISAQDKPLLHRWIENSGIRWGLNASHRTSLGLPDDLPTALEQNTWQFGLRRMLLGYAAGRADQVHGQCWQDIEAFDEIGGLSAALVGKLAHLLRLLEQSRLMLSQPASVADWTQRLSQLMSQFFVVEDDSELILLTRAEKMLRDWRDACTQAQFDDELSIEVVREFVLEQLDVQPLTQRFLAGAVNFATLMPMRAIPFRHICLLGMNDGEYPRQVPTVDFDLMRDDYRPGDRSRRDDDRYLFLEALLSARTSLYFSWAGRNIRDNSERPPSVLVAQLRDYLAETRGQHVLDSITREHPLQPFSALYFTAGSDFYTYAEEWAPTLTAATDSRATMAQNLAPQEQVIALSDLEKLLRLPANVFFEKSLGVSFSTEEVISQDHEIFYVDGLTRWQLHTQLIADAVRYNNAVTSVETLIHEVTEKQRRSGSLPFPPFADSYAHHTQQRLLKPLQKRQALLEQYQQDSRFNINLVSSDGLVILEDVAADIFHAVDDHTQRIRIVLLGSQLWAGKSDSKPVLKWKYLARLWPAHLAAQLHGPVRTWILGPDTQEVLEPLPAQQARQILVALIDLWQKNLRSPLAACVHSSCAWLTANEGQAESQARAQYEGAFHSDGELKENYSLQRLWPHFDELLKSNFASDSEALYTALTTHWFKHRNTASAEDSQ